MSSPLTAAVPPLAVIVSTTSWAGETSPPSPWREPPMSLTMTVAPSDASSRASSRPMPRPAPVTMAIFPSNSPMRFLSIGADVAGR